MNQIYNKNILYLQSKVPQLYQILSSLESPKNNIDVNLAQLDTIISQFCENPTALYRAPSFIKTHPEISPISDSFIQEIESKIPIQQQNKDIYHTHLDSLPILLLIGIVNGKEILQLIQLIDIKKLIIVDSDFEMLKNSMYEIEWQPIFEYFSRESYSLEFKISSNPKPLSMDILNHIYQNNLFYSYFIPYFNAVSKQFNNNIIQELQKNYRLLFNGWGFYDDEITSLTHTIKNLQNNISFLSKTQTLPDKSSIFIIGSGPSLDKDIQIIKNLQNKAVIVSCGTALIPLEANNIVPDFHIEIERPISTYERLLKFHSQDYLKQINFIGLNVIYPQTFSLFKTAKLFFRSIDCGSSIISKVPKLNHCNPTVTNGALSLVSYLGFNNIYLFGVDMGYEDEKRHHSQYNVYNDANSTYHGWKPNTVNIQFPKNFDKSQTIYSSDILSWAKQRIENCIKDYKIAQQKDITYYNCSDGAYIEGTITLESKEIKEPQNKNEILPIIEECFSKKDSRDIDYINQTNQACEMINTIIDIFDNNKHIQSFSQLFDILNKTFKIIDTTKGTLVYSLLSGTIPLLYKTIYIFSLQANNLNSSFEFINNSFTTITNFLNKVKEDLYIYTKESHG